jgi:transcriptional regulator with XRE-family HTH domain
MQDSTYTQLLRLGRAIASARAETGLSQEKFAERAGLFRTYIGKVERAEANVSFENIIRISRALKLKPSELFTRARL